MIVGINQPYFIPYIGYWQLIDSVDLFAIADNYNYIKRGWVNRNRILDKDTVRYYTLDVERASQNRYITEHFLKPLDKEKKLSHLDVYYHKAPYFNEGMELMDRMFSFEGNNLADFLYNSICLVSEYLGIRTKIVRTSDYEQDPSLRFADRVYDYCRQMGADEYHNPIGGMALYSFEEFAAHGLKLSFVEAIPREYPQSSSEFIFGLSIIDIIMNNNLEQIRQLLDSRRLITEP